MASTQSVNKKPRSKPTATPEPLPAEGFIRKPQVLAALAIGSTTLREGILCSAFPPGVLLSPRLRVWDVRDIRALIEKIRQGQVTLPTPSKKTKPETQA